MWDKLFDELYLRTYAPLQSEEDAEAQARAGFDPVAGVNETLHELVPRAGDPVSLTYRVRIYTAGEVVGLLRRAGFATVDVHGDLAGAPLTRESRLVLVATR